jgi:hypothetical protein
MQTITVWLLFFDLSATPFIFFLSGSWREKKMSRWSSLLRLRSASPHWSDKDLLSALTACEQVILSGVQFGDPRLFEDYHDFFFGAIFENPSFSRPFLLPRIFKMQVLIVLSVYPKFQLDVFSRNDDGVLSLSDPILGGFLTAFGRFMADPSFLGPIIVYDVAAISQLLLEDGSQLNIFLTLTERLQARHPAILEAFSRLPRWIDSQILLNTGFVESVLNLLSVDQSSPIVLSVVIECATLLKWRDADCLPLFDLIQNFHWLQKLIFEYNVTFLGPRLGKLAGTHRDQYEPAMILQLEQFLANPVSIQDLLGFWEFTSEDGCRNCVQIAGSSVGRFLDENEPNLLLFTRRLSGLLFLLENGPCSKPELKSEFEDCFFLAVDFTGGESRAERFCSLLLEIATSSLQVELPIPQWVMCASAVLQVFMSRELEGEIWACVHVGKLIHIALVQSSDFFKNKNADFNFFLSKVVGELSRLLLCEGFECENEVKAVVNDLSHVCGRLIDPSELMDKTITHLAKSGETVQIALEFISSRYQPHDKRYLLAEFAAIQYEAPEHLVTILRMIAYIWEPRLLPCSLQARGKKSPHTRAEIASPTRNTRHPRNLKDPDSTHTNPTTVIEPDLLEGLKFFESLKHRGLVTAPTLVAFVEAAVVVTRETGMKLWFPEVAQVMVHWVVLDRILECFPPDEMLGEFIRYLEGISAPPLQIGGRSRLVETIKKVLARYRGVLPEGFLSLKFKDELVAKFKQILNDPRVRKPENYSSQPNHIFSEMYDAIQDHFQCTELMDFVECANVRFAQLFTLIQKGYGVFDDGWHAWRSFMMFHRFLYQSLQVEFVWPASIPLEFEHLPYLYGNVLRSDDQVLAQATTEFEASLKHFEKWLHDHRSHVMFWVD